MPSIFPLRDYRFALHLSYTLFFGSFVAGSLGFVLFGRRAVWLLIGAVPALYWPLLKIAESLRH